MNKETILKFAHPFSNLLLAFSILLLPLRLKTSSLKEVRVKGPVYIQGAIATEASINGSVGIDGSVGVTGKVDADTDIFFPRVFKTFECGSKYSC